jgi:hypothetical protein
MKGTFCRQQSCKVTREFILFHLTTSALKIRENCRENEKLKGRSSNKEYRIVEVIFDTHVQLLFLFASEQA